MYRPPTARTTSRVAPRQRDAVGNRLGLPLVALGIVWLVLVVHLAGTYFAPLSTVALHS